MANYYGGFGINNGNGVKQPPTKEQLKERQKKIALRNRRKMLLERKNIAVTNLKDKNRYDDDDLFEDSDSNGFGDAYGAVDQRFARDLQNMKFCRKPVGFFMSLFFLITIALLALSFIPISLPSMVTQYTSIFAETEPKEVVEETDEEEEDEDEAANSALPANADEDEEEEEEEEEGTNSETTEGKYHKFSDPVYGWISFILGKLNLNISLGDSSWYDTQLSKVETGMEDTIAPIAIQAFPAAIILYAIFALVMFVKTFICWASGDRRIFRHTGVECFIMLLLGIITFFGGYATTVEVTGKMDFGGIVNFAIGMFNGAGGFTAGVGLLAMVGLPLIELFLSFFLLEKKLRSRDVLQPIIVYDSKRGR